MKPVKIEPRDITITAEHNVGDLKKLKTYLELSLKVTKRLYENANEVEIRESLGYVETELLPTIDQLLRHPVIQELGHGS